ncbi:MAG: flagellin [Pseudobdellovibrio sp.]
MSLRINTNVSSLAIQHAMTLSQRVTDQAINNIATGSRLSNPASDVAGTAIAEQMKSEITSLGAAKSNASSAVGIVSVAEGSLSEQSSILTRMRELAVQSASDTYSDKERSMMQKEFVEIRDESDRIAQSTKYGTQNLLDGSINKFEFQVGSTAGAESRISYNSESNTTSDNLGISSSDVSSKGDARDSLSDIDQGLEKIAMQRASFGATQSRLESVDSSLGSRIEGLSNARSKVADSDLAKEISDLRRGQILQQYQASMLQQVNDQAGLALKLVG